MKNLCVILALSLCCFAPSFGAIVEHVGSGLDWDVNWTGLPGLNDPVNSEMPGRIDFVGDDSNTGAYWADNGSYVFFRFQVNVATAIDGTFHDSHMVLIDVDNYLYGSGFGTDSTSLQPDFGFTWDSQSSDPEGHGLEMSVAGALKSTWGTSKMADLDGVNGKTAVDINGDITGRGYDGFIRSTDGQITENFGTTTFVDFAVAWSYLEAYTDLERGQTWNVALASIDNANDHNFMDDDIAGGADETDLISSGWTEIAAVPEPATISLIGLSGLFLLIGRRIKNR